MENQIINSVPEWIKILEEALEKENKNKQGVKNE